MALKMAVRFSFRSFWRLLFLETIKHSRSTVLVPLSITTPLDQAGERAIVRNKY